MANVSRKWKSSTWRLGKSRAKEPEMVESPLPHGWSFAHDLDHREQNHQLQSESAVGLLDKQSSIHVQGRLSESPEVRERLERLVSESTKRPGHARSDSAGSLRMASHVSNIINFEQAYNKLKGERDMFEEFFLAEQTRLRCVEEEFVAKEVEFASVMHQASRAADLERELKSSSDYCAKLEQQIQEKTLEAKATNEHIRTYIGRNQVAESSEQEQRMKELEDEQSRTNASLKLEVTRLKEQLARSDARCLETKQALDSKSIEIHLMKERVRRIEGQLAKSEEEGTRLQEKILILEEEVSQLQADNMELQLQLELESNNEAKLEEDWINERAEWEARVAHLETELNLASCTNGELDFLITPMKGASDRTLGSPRTPTGRFSIQTLLDLGEASLEVEDDFHELQLKHADAEVRVQSATFELQKKEQQLVELREIVSQMKVELAAEKEKAKEEAEDLTQEMAELRYQLMEMVEQERELRAQVEQASVLRVEELEAQVKDARKEVLHSLVRHREAEENAEGCTLEVQRLQLANENLEKGLKEAKENAMQAKEEAEAELQQAKKDAQHLAESNLELEKQVTEVRAACDCLSSENLHLRRSLDEAMAGTVKLEQTLVKKESEYLSLLEVERNALETSMTTAVAKLEEKVLSFEKKESQFTSLLEQERKELEASKAALVNYEKEQISLLERESEYLSVIKELRKQLEVLKTPVANLKKEQQAGGVTKMELVNNTHDKEMQTTGISLSLSREEGDDSPLETNPEIAALERETEGLDLEKSEVKHLHRHFPEENTFSSEHEIQFETRVRSWSNLLIRTLQSKLAVSGAVEEQGEHGSDLLGESRCELASSTHEGSEVEIGSVETLCQEQVTANKECVTHSKDDPERLEQCPESEISQRDDNVSNLEQKPQTILELELHLKNLQENVKTGNQLLSKTDEETHKYSDSLVLPS